MPFSKVGETFAKLILDTLHLKSQCGSKLERRSWNLEEPADTTQPLASSLTTVWLSLSMQTTHRVESKASSPRPEISKS